VTLDPNGNHFLCSIRYLGQTSFCLLPLRLVAMGNNTHWWESKAVHHLTSQTHQEKKSKMSNQIEEEQRKFVTPKSIIWFIIAMTVMTGYYLMVNIGLMKVQGMDFFYLWNAGAGGG